MKISQHAPVVPQMVSAKEPSGAASSSSAIDAHSLAEARISRPYSIGKVASCIEVVGAFGTIRNHVTLGSYEHFVELEKPSGGAVLRGDSLLALHQALADHLATLPADSTRGKDVAYLLHVVEAVATRGGHRPASQDSRTHAQVTGRTLDTLPSAPTKVDPSASPLSTRLSNSTRTGA